ncbi:MAG: adenylyltransferase/cytidyltransferase family protein [Nanoarchaeota archaeon]|nr:adenylyltransferase/cytidyltransferase family protein [Nanoarchaeota archaeon]
MKQYKKLGLIGRFKPPHLGAVRMLEAVCEAAEHVIIGIGSSNKYNLRNPFTPQETRDMIATALPGRTNYLIVEIPDYAQDPDYADGQRWKQDIIDSYGTLDAFVTGNPYVKQLLENTYTVIHPATLIPKEQHLVLRATEVRLRIAQNNNWETHVPEAVATYIKTKKLDERFRKEFGLATLATTLTSNYKTTEAATAEAAHTREQ